ncbi:MAG: isoprenoid biosynthesis glyoxalase ElbB [Rikenellaceae bacterium]
MKRVAILLAGCGSGDGSEIQESVLALTALSEAGIAYECFAMNKAQKEVVDHLCGEATGQTRVQIVEAARIARGAVRDFSELCAEDFDAVVIPGGFGTAKNFFSFAADGIGFSVDEDYRRVVSEFHSAGKPVAAMCIAPLSLPAIIEGVTITLGERGELAEAAEAHYGATVLASGVSEAVVDSLNRVITVPCYMYSEATVAEIAAGARSMVGELSSMLG